MAKEKTEKKDYFKNFKEHKLSLPRNEAWGNFKSWKDAKPGEYVQGFVRDAFYLPEERDEDGNVEFRDQRGITLEQENGELINVTVKTLPFVLKETDSLRLGDPLTVEFEKEGTKKKKSHNAPKIFKFYGVNLPENADQPTIKELYEKDKAEGGSRPPEEDKDADEKPSRAREHDEEEIDEEDDEI